MSFNSFWCITTTAFISTFYDLFYLCSFYQILQNPLNTTNCRKTHLPEEQVCVRAVPLLLLPSLQHHNRFWHNAIVSFQPWTQSSAVLGKKSSRHPQGVVTQPVDRSAGQTDSWMEDKVGRETRERLGLKMQTLSEKYICGSKARWNSYFCFENWMNTLSLSPPFFSYISKVYNSI